MLVRQSEDFMSKPTKTVKVSVPKAKIVEAAASDTPDGPVMLKKGEVLDKVVAETGIKRSDAKAVVEGFLTLLAAELKEGRDMQLPPLGKIKLVKSKVVGQGATALTVKIRQPKPDTDPAV